MMTDTTRPLVVGLMQTPPYDRMFEQSRRVYSAKGISPTLHTQGGGWSRDKGINRTIKKIEHERICDKGIAKLRLSLS